MAYKVPNGSRGHITFLIPCHGAVCARETAMNAYTQNVISRFNPHIVENSGQTVVLGHGLGTDQTA